MKLLCRFFGHRHSMSRLPRLARRYLRRALYGLRDDKAGHLALDLPVGPCARCGARP